MAGGQRTLGSPLFQCGAPVPHELKSWWNLQFLEELRLGVTAKVRTSHGPTTEEILRA
jgi:hypothetical protein